MPNPNPLAAKAVDAALLVDAKLDRLIDLIGQHRTARIKEAQQTYTAKTSGLRARLETEYAILGAIEDAFGCDLTNDRDAIACECRDECGFDIEADSFLSDVPVQNFGQSHPDSGRGFRVGGAA